ncbi:hypothetical protein CEXT_186611 [Caerostris extrusa]|uniref:Uncharacterized protein n=1 Tax=Caerostris extrusa TaxID=172846 RepID=A0AAV4QSK5_CAEEX|nr:hypothetical protein CEXT_186611 [Caerostris extrusa]
MTSVQLVIYLEQDGKAQNENRAVGRDGASTCFLSAVGFSNGQGASQRDFSQKPEAFLSSLNRGESTFAFPYE